jgi:putative ABC transport system substrate-binding protein
MSPVRRRRLLIAAGALFATPLGALAQQPGRVWRIGFLYFGSRKAAQDTGRLDAFLQEMRKLGYVQGSNLTVEERYADGNNDRVPALVAEMVRLKPDVIVATGGATYRPLRNATTTIPIVITVTVDPISAGYAATLARPGGNLTGLTDTATGLGPKHLELLVAAAPRLSRVAVLLNPDNPSHGAQLVRMMSDAQKIGKQVTLIEARTPNDIEAGFSTMARERADALIVFADTFFVDQMRHIAERALKAHIPSAHPNPDFALAGGLLSYGSDLLDNFRRAAVYVDKILKGANPGDLPFEQPTKYQLLINLRTARALGLTIPQSLLLRADRVIE